MATDPRGHVRPGEKLRIAAEQINWINRQMAADTSFGGGALAGIEPGKNIIMARNNTGGDVPRWGVMAIGGVEVNPTAGDTQRRSFEEQPCITGTMPSATTGAAFCIAVEPIKAGKIGRVAVAGVVQAKLTVGSGVTGDRARPHASRDTLELAADGPARVLWMQSGSGTVWGLVRIDDRGSQIRIGKTGGKWAFGTCATITIFEEIPSAGSCPLPTASNETIQNVINLTRDVPANAWVVICRARNGRWHLAEAHDRFAIRVGKVSADWAIGTCASVNVWEQYVLGSCQPVAGESTGGSGEFSGIPSGSPLTIENVANLKFNVQANSWVVIGRAGNDRWYLLSSGIEGSCRQTIGGEDITKWTGWDGSKVQLLGHDANGCLKWFDSEECEEPSPGTP